mmetsp:Transcript_17286/g.36317  ORF Transcript_17286/g.36317 Transcript_17286/m.36317 type:complete len:91 (+) Transcript_17286:634-906(+)
MCNVLWSDLLRRHHIRNDWGIDVINKLSFEQFAIFTILSLLPVLSLLYIVILSILSINAFLPILSIAILSILWWPGDPTPTSFRHNSVSN